MRLESRIHAANKTTGSILSRLASALEEPCFGGSRAAHIAGAGATKDQLEEIVADESLALIDHYRIVRGALYKGFSEKGLAEIRQGVDGH
jgi:hypothetical protein